MTDQNFDKIGQIKGLEDVDKLEQLSKFHSRDKTNKVRLKNVNKGSKSFAVSGTISAGKTYLLNQINSYLNNPDKTRIIKSKYPKLSKYIDNFEVYFETPNEKILKRYYDAFTPSKNFGFFKKLLALFVFFSLSIITFYISVLHSVWILILVLVFDTLVVCSIFQFLDKKQKKLTPVDVSFDTQIHFLRNRLKTLYRLLHMKGLAAIDRSWFEDYIFPCMQYREKMIPKLHFDIYKDFFIEYSRYMPYPDFWIFLDVTPEKAYQNLKTRIAKRRFNGKDTSGEEGITLGYLKQLGKEYEKFKQNMKKQFGEKFIIVDNNSYQSIETFLKIIHNHL